MSEEKKRSDLEDVARRISAAVAEFSEALKQAAELIGAAVAPLLELNAELEKKNKGLGLTGNYVEILNVAPLVVLGTFPSFNKWKGRHWSGYSKQKNQILEDLGKLLRLAGINPFARIPPRTPAIVEVFVYQKTRRLDEDNLAGQMKPFFDSLRELGLIYQDSPKWLTRDLEQGVDRDNPRVEIRSIKWDMTLASAPGTLRKEVKRK
jgi:hypothetical protein